MTESRETYTVSGQPTITVIEPPWELTPEPPDDTPPLLDMFAADLVLDCAVKWFHARNALAHAGKSNGNDLMRAYLDAEELLAGATTLYEAVAMDGHEDEECEIP